MSDTNKEKFCEKKVNRMSMKVLSVKTIELDKKAI